MFTLLLAGGLPAVAQAQTPTAPGTPAPGAPVQTTMALTIDRVGGARSTALVGARLRVRGAAPAFVPGETVVVRFFVAGRKRASRRVALQPGARGGGAIRLSYTPTRPGPLSIRVAHDASPALGAFVATARTVDVLPRRVTRRSGGASIRALQRRLRRLGYVTGSPGRFDGRTARAVLAFRKVTGMARTTSASGTVMRALARGRGRFAIRSPGQGRHIEADLSRQVIALIEGGRVRRIYPISSGAPSTPTVLGTFKVYRKDPGTNALGMVHSAYFIRGYATHGYKSVPIFPASHGCLRVPVPDALRLFNWIKIGTPVVVYP